MNDDNMDYVLDKLVQIAEILTRLQKEIDALSLRVDMLERKS